MPFSGEGGAPQLLQLEQHGQRPLELAVEVRLVADQVLQPVNL